MHILMVVSGFLVRSRALQSSWSTTFAVSQPLQHSWKRCRHPSWISPKQRHPRQPHSFARPLWMTATQSEGNVAAKKTWDIGGLKKEVERAILRCHKKLGKTNQRIERLTAEGTDANDDVDEVKATLAELQARLERLNELEESVKSLPSKKKNVTIPSSIEALLTELQISDTPPPRPPRGPGKQKGPRRMETSRKPYRRYYSHDNIEIRVGKQAEDNDVITFAPEHRDDWWMHASGCPGSHVVIRCRESTVPEAVVKDAAALAARQSKCTGGNIRVSMTRCRDIVKPRGAKPGLVQLTGRVRTVSVNMKEAQERLERLETTMLLN